MKKFWQAGCAAVTALGMAPWCTAQTAGPAYPSKPVRMVIPFAAGGGVDIVGRLVGARLRDDLGQPFIADNRGGSGGTVGTDIVAKAPGDGYTLMVTNSSLAYGPSLYPKLPYDTLKDLAAVSLVGVTPSVLVVHPSVPAKSVRELIDLMKAKPGQLNYGSGGVGGSPHLAIELFQSMAGVSATNIPYKGVAPALIDTVSGQVQLMMAGIPGAIGHVKGNRLRALAVSGSKRSPALPDLPTIAEAGLPGYEYTTWYGILVPAGTPKTMIAKLNQGAARTLGNPELRDKLAQQGVEAESSTPEHFAATVKQEIARWGKIIKAAGIRGE